MRTTLDIDERLLLVVKSLSAQTGKSMGKIVSELLAKALVSDKEPHNRNDLPVFPRSGEGPVTMEIVNQLRDGDLR